MFSSVLSGGLPDCSIWEMFKVKGQVPDGHSKLGHKVTVGYLIPVHGLWVQIEYLAQECGAASHVRVEEHFLGTGR